MGITNTIAQLKAYFETWHEDAYDTLHNASISVITDTVNRIETLESWVDANKKKVQQFENFINGYTNGTNVTKTLRNLVDADTTNSNNIATANTNIANIKKWTYMEEIDTQNYDSIHAYVNEDLRIVSLYGHIYVDYYTSYKGKWKNADVTILPAYKPKQPVYFVSSPYTTGCILTNGKVQFKSIYGAQDALYFNMYAMWHY